MCGILRVKQLFETTLYETTLSPTILFDKIFGGLRISRISPILVGMEALDENGRLHKNYIAILGYYCTNFLSLPISLEFFRLIC